MRERREKGLCYNYDEKWNSSHRCKSPKLYLIHGHELCADEKLEEVLYDSTDMVEPGSELLLLEDIAPEISLHAISGSLSPKTMRLIEMTKNQRVVILIDSGSTHNFIDPTVFNKVSLGILTLISLQVRMANGATVLSQRKCVALSLKVQGTVITTDFSPSLSEGVM